jgi:non-ribosomal peptide synthetase component F
LQGEVIVSGSNIAMGYFKNDALTNEAFITHKSVSLCLCRLFVTLYEATGSAGFTPAILGGGTVTEASPSSIERKTS